MKMSEFLKPMPDPRYIDIDIRMRFLEKVDIKGPNDCWEWTACYTNGDGIIYGRFTLFGKVFIASRVSYWLHNKIDPSGLYVCHECNNTKCVNPKHLFMGTASENSQQCADECRRDVKGSKHPKSVLIEEQVINIRALIDAHIPYKIIAEKFNVSESAISHVANGHCWSHI